MRKKDLARKITSWITLGVFSMQPILTFAAEILPDTSAPISQQPLVMETASAHPLVQIAPPSAGGVSMNLYTFFNVPERGAILNNSYNLSNTELAGYVQGNPNLMGGTARIIVNEVTSANPSELRGFLEVAGDRAGVVIANPNRILADGAGFLNTARITLATGHTMMDATGNLAALRIDDGKVVITGNGLNAKGVDSAELYACAIEINAGLWAEHAKIVTGVNTIGYTDGEISPITADSNTPSYALDLSAIGGMYANRIALVGTEKGLGVNLEGQTTSTQATSLDVNGNLKTSGNLYSDGTTSIHAKDIENSGTIYSVADTDVSATALQNDGKIIYMSINLNVDPASDDEKLFAGWTKLAMRLHRDMDGKISFNGLAGDAYNFDLHQWKLGDPEYSWKNAFTDTINNGAWVNQSLGYLQPFPWTAEIQGTVSLSED